MYSVPSVVYCLPLMLLLLLCTVIVRVHCQQWCLVT